MTSRRRRWWIWMTIGVGVVAALVVARRRAAPALSKAQHERASIDAHAVVRYALPLEQRDCALARLSPVDGTEWPQGLQLSVHAPSTDRELRRFELGKAALEFGFCVESAGTYELELRTADRAASYDLTLDAVLPRPLEKSAKLAGIGALMSPRVRALSAKLPDLAQLDQFWSEVTREGTPLVEPADSDSEWVTFLYRGADTTGSVAVSWQMLSPELADTRLTRLPGTNLWWKSLRLPNTTRLSYQLTIDAPAAPAPLRERAQAAVTQVDALNKSPMLPELPLDAYAQRSTLQLSAAAPERWRDSKPVPAHGRLEQRTLTSQQLGHAHALTVYVPNGYDKAVGQRFPLLIFFDGDSYLHDEESARLLDKLIAERAIPPMVAVFVLNDEPSQRASELPCNPSFAAFVALELLPFVRAHYRLSSEAAQTGLAGSSFGGLASSFIALTYPESFGKVLSQSGSYWWSFERDSPQYDGSKQAGWLRRRFAERPTGQIQFYLSAGVFEASSDGNGLLEENRRLRDTLRASGYSVQYQELASGHDHLAWRASLPDALIALFGANR